MPVESLWQDAGDIPNESVVAAQLAEAEQLAADYYTRQRTERLRDK